MAEENAETLQAQQDQVEALDAQIAERVQAEGDEWSPELRALIGQRNTLQVAAGKLDLELNPGKAP